MTTEQRRRIAALGRCRMEVDSYYDRMRADLAGRAKAGDELGPLQLRNLETLWHQFAHQLVCMGARQPEGVAIR